MFLLGGYLSLEFMWDALPWGQLSTGTRGERESQGASKLLKGAKTYKLQLRNRQACPTIIMVTIGRHLLKKSWVPNWSMMLLFLLKIFDSISWSYRLFNIVWDHLIILQTEKVSCIHTLGFMFSSWHHVLALDLNKITKLLVAMEVGTINKSPSLNSTIN
jgi:hypothetical protein